MSFETIDGKKLIRDSIYDVVNYKLHNFINDLSVELHSDNDTKGGDITPTQVQDIENSIHKIANTMAEQVIQNMKI